MRENWVINNQYLILEKIGIGGAATVYKAWDNMLQKFVAIKKIHDEFASDAKYVDMFRREAVNTAKLENENIVRVVNFIKEPDGNLYIVMDYVKGVDCEYLIEKCRKNSIVVPVEIALYMISEVIKGLDYAHSVHDEMTDEPLNIIHRDISPGNILLSFDGRIKLTDFGIAKAGDAHNKEEKGKLAGKIAYMSPEQAEARSDIDARSDLFSTGLIMYELLVGEKAYIGDSDVDIIQDVQNAAVNFKRLKERDIPEDIQRIMKKIFQKSPDKRYQSAAEMFIEIKRYLSKRNKTEELKSDYKSFIRDILDRELQIMKQEMEKDSQRDFNAMNEIVRSAQMNPAPQPQAAVKEAPAQHAVPDISEKITAAETEPAVEKPRPAEKKSAEVQDVPKEKPQESIKEETVSEREYTEVEINEKLKTLPETSKVKTISHKEYYVPPKDKKAVPEPKVSDVSEPEAKPPVKELKEQKPVKKAQPVFVEEEIEIEDESPVRPSVPELDPVEVPVKKVAARKAPAKQKLSPEPAYMAEESSILKESDDKEKTVFDFVLDTAKRYKRFVISVIISIFIGSIIFTVLDTYMRLTLWGNKIHNILWPPALQIDSFPSGANISIYKDDINIIDKEGYRATTPTFIEELQPGLYTLVLQKSGFGEQSRRITVFGKEHNNQSIAIGGAKVVNGVYIVPFEVGVEIKSVPSNAQLFIDDKRVGLTPFKGTLELGSHNFYLTKEGFENLGDNSVRFGADYNDVKFTLGICMLDNSKTAAQQKKIDERFWKVQEKKDTNGGTGFVLTGTMWKKFSVDSIPEEAKVFVNTSAEPIGMTPLENLVLPAGIHTLKLQKEGYVSKEKTVEVTAGSKNTVSLIMDKIFTVHTYKEGTSKSHDIASSFSIEGTEVKGKTPLKVTLPHGEYTFKFSNYPKYKYKVFSTNIGKLKDKLYVKMLLQPPHLLVDVKDYNTGKAIKSATIWVSGSYWRTTDYKGSASDYLKKASGEYEVEVKAKGYDSVKTSVKVSKGNRSKLKVVMGVPKDAKLIVKVPDKYYGTSIFLDGEYVGEDSQVIENVGRSYHDLEFRLNSIDKKVNKKVQISKPGQMIILKLGEDEKGNLSVTEEYPPSLYVEVKDFSSGKPIPEASLYLNGVFWMKTDTLGKASGYIEDMLGEIVVLTQVEGYEDFTTVTELELDNASKVYIKLGAPRDATIVLDVPEEVFDLSIYLDGNYMGDNLPLISDVLRINHVLELRSSLFDENVAKDLKITKPNQLVMLRVVKKKDHYMIEEISSDNLIE